jgi:hypothetical protein
MSTTQTKFLLPLTLLTCTALLSMGTVYIAMAPRPASQNNRIGALTYNMEKIPYSPEVHREGGTIPPALGPARIQIKQNQPSGTSLLLDCGTFRSQRKLSGSTPIVFPEVPNSDCQVRISTTDTAFKPVFPGDELNCSSVAGVTTCQGGVADKKPAIVNVSSAVPGTLSIDGRSVGTLPMDGLKLAAGQHQLMVTLKGSEFAPSWPLLVHPDEQVDIFFPQLEKTVETALVNSDVSGGVNSSARSSAP